MIDFLKKQSTFTKIEFWAFTTLVVFVMFFFITDGLDGPSAMADAPNKPYFEKANIPYSYYTHFFIPQLIHNIVLFIAFFSMNFLIIPKLVKREAVLKNIVLIVLIFVACGVISGIVNTYLKAYMYTNASKDETDQIIFRDSFDYSLSLFAVLLIYTSIKYAGLFLLSKIDAIHKRFSYITREAIVASIIWLVMLLLLWIGGGETSFTLSWITLIPYAIFLYSISFHRIIPKSLTKKHAFLSYLFRTALTIALLFFPVLMLLMLFMRNEGLAFNVSFFNTVFQFFVTVPLTWLLYKRRQRGNEEVIVLEKELKKSTANIDFLRSQINPHFLFNILNTLYGTAIQEKAERTSEGIERLGDMMRFMLQENMQDKISLSREIDYLNNYIGLQKLRTDTNPIVQIQTQIESRETLFQIAPMLLIPFVENAFKHGISFREASHIKVTLEIKNNTLYFDVYNSKHARPDNDPEKDKSGIGLENVRQRLNLLYPGRHELIIRDTTREFFVHLTIQLT
ncbi:MAG: histidine kinase [Chitinophagaceae bacterium]